MHWWEVLRQPFRWPGRSHGGFCDSKFRQPGRSHGGAAQVERCLAQACAPLLEMICCWLFEGWLSSAAGDFFIISNPLPNGVHAPPACLHSVQPWRPV